MVAKILNFTKTNSLCIIMIIVILNFKDAEQEEPAMFMNDTILSNAPWSVKLLLLKDIKPKPAEYIPNFRNSDPTVMENSLQQRALQKNPRRVGVEALVQRQEAPVTETTTPHDEDSNMRLKLFRLMYETVKDSDIKVRRAELIKQHYMNTSFWEIGYLMGDMQEKFDIINEFSSTLNKFYDAWKPIEHINAYEQIANYAIQVNTLVDLIKSHSRNIKVPRVANTNNNIIPQNNVVQKLVF